MKTAMQELQDALEIYSRHNKGTPEGKAIDITLSAFSKFIEVEKEQIARAWESGYSNGVRSVSRGEPKIKSSEEYYQQTFKSNK